MFRLHRHKQEKSGERIDFKFSHFHALQVFIRDTGESTIHGILFLSLSLWLLISQFPDLDACHFGSWEVSVCFQKLYLPAWMWRKLGS